MTAEVWPVVAATGHRPQHLTPTQQAWVRAKLRAATTWLRDQHGTKTAISGMALGVDTWWAHAALHAGITLHAYVPFPEQTERWPRPDRDVWAALLGFATHVEYAGELGTLTDDARRKEAVRLLHRRNDMMLDDATAVIAVLDPARRGGTYSAVLKAVRRGLPGVYLNPATMTVHNGLPDLRRGTR